MAIGFPTKANWAAGDVLTASALDDLAGTVNLLSNASAASGSVLLSNVAGASFVYQGSQAAGKNYILNGSQEIWQRGTSFASTGAPYCSDRWQLYSSTAPATATRQGASSTGYYARVQRNSGSALGGTIYYGTSLESASTIPLIGKTVVMSFSARAGANYSAASNALFPYIVYGTGTDQNLFTGLTGQTTVATSTVTLTTSWQRFSITGTVSASATQLAAYLSYVPTGTAGANDYFEIDDVQLELGSVPTTFTPAGGTLQGELSACQRYYTRLGAANGLVAATYSRYGSGYVTSATNASVIINLPVTMRVLPSLIDYTNAMIQDATGATFVTSAIALDTTNVSFNSLGLNCTISGATSGRFAIIQNNNTAAGYLGFGAEL
jgi:hypothetical protein